MWKNGEKLKLLQLKLCQYTGSSIIIVNVLYNNKKAVLPQGNRAMPQVFFSVEVRQQHSLQV